MLIVNLEECTDNVLNFLSVSCTKGCLENSDLENSDPRPEKLRPSGVSKTQTQKTQTLRCLENSDPKNSDPWVSRKLRPENSDPKTKTYLYSVNAASRLVYCSSIQWHYQHLPRKEKTACSVTYVQRS